MVEGGLRGPKARMWRTGGLTGGKWASNVRLIAR